MNKNSSFKLNIKELIKKNLLLFIFLDLILILYFLSLLDIIPYSSEIVTYLKNLYDNYGLIILFIISLIEGFLFFGLYFNGSAIIILAVALTNGNLIEIIKIILTVGTGLSLMNIVNFTIGKYSTRTSQKEIKKKPYIFLYFIHPSFIAYYVINLAQNNKSYFSLIPVFLGTYLSGICYSIIITALVLLF